MQYKYIYITVSSIPAVVTRNSCWRCIVVYLLNTLCDCNYADNASDCNSPNVQQVPTPINQSPDRVAIYAKFNIEFFTYNNKRKEISDGCMVHGSLSWFQGCQKKRISWSIAVWWHHSDVTAAICVSDMILPLPLPLLWYRHRRCCDYGRKVKVLVSTPVQKQRYFIGSFQLMLPKIDIPTGTCYKRGTRLNNAVEVLIKKLVFRTETGSTRVAIGLNCLLFALWRASFFSAFSAGYGRQGLVDKVVGAWRETLSGRLCNTCREFSIRSRVIGVGTA
jgi:hypothetical protein